VYGEDHVKRLGFIRRSRELGFTLDQIRTLLGLVDGRRYTCAQVKRITVEHLDEIHRKVADLRTIERVLKDMAAQCDGGAVPRCAVIDALFEPAQDGESEPPREPPAALRWKGSLESIRRSRAASGRTARPGGPAMAG
jgi:MerR family mercuric resistance operon transcriptional regulator